MSEKSKTCSVSTANKLARLKSVATCSTGVWGASLYTYKISVLTLRRKNLPVSIVLHLTIQLTTINGILGFQERVQEHIVYSAEADHLWKRSSITKADYAKNYNFKCADVEMHLADYLLKDKLGIRKRTATQILHSLSEYGKLEVNTVDGIASITDTNIQKEYLSFFVRWSSLSYH